MAHITYRLSRFGTVLLTPEQQDSGYLTIRVSSVVRRAVEYRNFNWLPPNQAWLQCVGIDRDGYVMWHETARWYKHGWIIWSLPESLVLFGLCVSFNGTYVQIMEELARKPNIPPLPPSPPIVQPPFSLDPRVQLPGITAFMFRALNDGDFDVTINWGPQPAPSACAPDPLPVEPPGPIEPTLPPPGPNMPSPPPLDTNLPPLLPTGSPPTGGTSLIPPGFPSGQQSGPPNTRTFKWRAGRTGFSPASSCGPEGTRSAAWPTPSGQFPPAWLSGLVDTEELLPVLSAQETSSDCTLPGGGPSRSMRFFANGVQVDANGSQGPYQLSNFKVYNDNGEWELSSVQASG